MRDLQKVRGKCLLWIKIKYGLNFLHQNYLSILVFFFSMIKKKNPLYINRSLKLTRLVSGLLKGNKQPSI